MKNKEKVLDSFSLDDQSLLEVINSSYLTLEDVKWLKSKRWFKRFLKVYVKELKRRYRNKPPIMKEIKTANSEDIEVLDFTKTINIPQKEVIEILDFTKTIDITDAKDIVNATNIAKKKVKFQKNFLTFVITTCALVIIGLVIILLNYYLETKKTDDIIDTIYSVAEFQEVTPNNTIEENDNNKIKNIYDEYVDTNMFSVNFDNLKNINPDTVGWIKVEGTKINYPYVQYTDNEFYLKHTFDKTSNKKGWVFLDYRNTTNTLDNNNVLYAHGLMNEQMFGTMRNIIKSSWYNNKENHIITIITPDRILKWQVFSTYLIEPESYYISVNFSSEASFLQFINTIKERSIHDYKVDVNVNDKILTLSSCYNKTKRMVLHAKLISNISN